MIVLSYLMNRDGYEFIWRMQLTRSKARNIRERISRLVVGDRQDHCMYDARSLARLTESCAFAGATDLPASTTTIQGPAGLNFFERAQENIFLEARKP